MSIFSNQYKTQVFVFLFDGFLMACEMYVHMTKCSIWVHLHWMWLSMGIDVRLWQALVG